MYRVDELLNRLDGILVSQANENRLTNIYKLGIFEKQKESQIHVDPGQLLTWIQKRLYAIKNELEGQIQGELKGLKGEQYVELRTLEMNQV